MYFRIKADKITHSRKVFNFTNWLGTIGGVSELLLYFFAIVYGGYAEFNKFIQNLNTLVVNQKTDEDCKRSSLSSIHIEDDQEIIDFNHFQKMQIYITMKLKCLNCCIQKKNKEHWNQLQKMLVKGLKQYEDDTNMKPIIIEFKRRQIEKKKEAMFANLSSELQKKLFIPKVDPHQHLQ